MTDLAEVSRIYRINLDALPEDGRPCEVCGGHMHDHAWADLDHDGFAVACSGEDDPPTRD